MASLSIEKDKSVTRLSAATRMNYIEFIDESPMNPMLWVLLIGCMVAQILDGFENQTISFALPLLSKEFAIDHLQAGVIGSVTNLGLFFGALLVAPWADKIGRKPILQWAIFFYAFGTMLAALAPTYNTLLCARFIAGLGMAAEFPAAFALLSEMAPRRLRHIFVGCGSIAYASGWTVCAIVATLVIPASGWRALLWVGVLPALMIFFVRRYIPESVRFLLSQGRTEEAGQIVRRLADISGYRDIELVAPPATAKAERITWRRQFSLLRLSAVTIAVFALFQLANNVQVTGVGHWLPSIFVKQGFTLTKSFRFTMIVLVATPIGQVLGMWLQDRMPRKWAILLFSALSAVCFVGFGLSFEYKAPVPVILGFNIGYSFFSGAVMPVFFTMSNELYDTRIRALSAALILAGARCGSITGPLVLGWLLMLGTEIHQIIYYFSMPLLAAAIILLFVIRGDSRQKSLDDVPLGH
ncbi:sugar (and other) transporter family protein [Paraburkholderia fungorum]|uniref:MFS transporter n=1 Tax=Paraburkholderia fungorum TaxID=134537 RepID=A0AAP1L638_9BURK|nr:MFS transporter [Paraburkholderia fungorum]AJZ56503.1 sugar (and other) transporter family protein [Paraburkholderia fungorum]MBB4519838.1 putative MFS transporter [Paraburkholderia fungorum]MDT8843509.1 MFS transporter [Paraburkholderia fungorum]